MIKVKLDQLVAIARLLEALSAGNFARARILRRHDPVSLGEMIEIFKKLDLAVSADYATDILATIVRQDVAAADVTNAEKHKKISEENFHALQQELESLRTVYDGNLKVKCLSRLPISRRAIYLRILDPLIRIR